MKIHTKLMLATLVSIVAVQAVHAARRPPASTPPPPVVEETVIKPVISPK